MEEIKLNSKEISRLDNSWFEELAISWKITKEEVKALSSERREKLKQVLSTNAQLWMLLTSVKETQSSSEKPSFSQSQVEFDWRYKKEWYTDMFILARALELGYIPDVHSLKIWDIFKWDKKIRNSLSYTFDWGPFTNWWPLSKSGSMNKEFFKYVREIWIEAANFERLQAKELLTRASKVSTLDRWIINDRFAILDRISTVLRNWTDDQVKAVLWEYKREFWKDKVAELAKRYKLNLYTDWIAKELRAVETALAANPTDPTLTQKKAALERMNVEMGKNPPNVKWVATMKVEYERNFRVNIADRRESLKKATREARPEMEAAKREVLAIDDKITDLRSKADRELKVLDKVVKDNPWKAKEAVTEAKKIVWDINIEIEKLEKKWVNMLSSHKFDPETVKLLKSESKLVKSLSDINEWFDKKVWKYWKWLIGASMLWMAFNATWWIKEAWKWWPAREEFLKDLFDMWAWIIPVAWWVHDFVIAWHDFWIIPDKWENGYRDFFWNRDKSMSEKDKYIREWFWVIWLIPWVWFVAKSAKFLKWAKAVNILWKEVQVANTAIHAIDWTMEVAKLGWKVFTYGYLGFSLVNAAVNIPYEFNKK